MTEDQQIGLRLKALIDDLDLTQSAISEQIGVHQGYFNQILKGRKRISATVIFAIAKRHKKLNLRWLLTGVGEMYGSEVLLNYPPCELPAGVDVLPDQVQEPEMKITNLKEKSLALRLDDHERRLRLLEQQFKKP